MIRRHIGVSVVMQSNLRVGCRPRGWIVFQDHLVFIPAVHTVAMRAARDVPPHDAQRTLEEDFIRIEAGGEEVLGHGAANHQSCHGGLLTEGVTFFVYVSLRALFIVSRVRHSKARE
jgi:hypothetical protein